MQIVEFLLLSSSWLLKLPSLAPREELIVFAYQIWKPQFLSVVQFPFDNCHSPFSPTTFFEIGVYLVLYSMSRNKLATHEYHSFNNPRASVNYLQRIINYSTTTALR